MDINNFPNPKLNLPSELIDSEGVKRDISLWAIDRFQEIDQYLNAVEKYIYTDINLNYKPSDADHIYAWMLQLVSSLVFRSLYIRNAFVDLINSRNAVGIFLPLKAWFETVGALASILELLEKNLSQEDMFKEMKLFILGNRGKGNFRVGNCEAKNVATMIEKADKYIAKAGKGQHDEGEERISLKNFFTDHYDISSNLSHPSFDAYALTSSMRDGNFWQLKEIEGVQKMIVDYLFNYIGLLTAPLFVEDICEKIFEKESVNFTKLKSRKYFNGISSVTPQSE